MTITAQQLLDEARLTIPECSPEEVRAAVNSAEPPLLVDVRETSEWDSGRVPGAVHIPRGLLEWKADPDYANHDAHLAGQNDARIVVMCASGGRSLLAAKTLREMGYRNVSSMAGGFAAWTQTGFPVEGAAR